MSAVDDYRRVAQMHADGRVPLSRVVLRADAAVAELAAELEALLHEAEDERDEALVREGLWKSLYSGAVGERDEWKARYIPTEAERKACEAENRSLVGMLRRAFDQLPDDGLTYDDVDFEMWCDGLRSSTPAEEEK